ncbi:uncharacterized protein METZ01_LOCUS198356, partial [marine metagenome]
MSVVSSVLWQFAAAWEIIVRFGIRGYISSLIAQFRNGLVQIGE